MNVRLIALAALGAVSAPAAAPGPARAASPPDGRAADAGGAAHASTSPGPLVDAGTAPAGADAWPHACSFRHPLCVVAAPGTPEPTAAAALAAAERAWGAVTGALGAPAPDGGLDGAWRVYLVDTAGGPGSARAILGARAPLARFDRASSFALVDRRTPPGCAIDLALARAVAGGSAWRAAPAVDPGSSAAQVEALARLATPCSAGEASDDDREFQAAPERTLVDPSAPSFDRGASLFFGWLDAAFGVRPGALLVSLWAIAPTETPAGAPRWAGAPTWADVLRVSLADALWRGSTLDDVFVRFAAVRWSMTPPPRPAWSVPWPARPRRLAPREPTEPTGSGYVVVGCSAAPAGARLRIEAQWEDYARMRWIVLELGASGDVLDEIQIPSTNLATQAAMTIENLRGVARVVVAGVNVGSTERPFDPDDGVWEPHGWLLTLESL